MWRPLRRDDSHINIYSISQGLKKEDRNDPLSNIFLSHLGRSSLHSHLPSTVARNTPAAAAPAPHPAAALLLRMSGSGAAAVAVVPRTPAAVAAAHLEDNDRTADIADTDTVAVAVAVAAEEEEAVVAAADSVVVVVAGVVDNNSSAAAAAAARSVAMHTEDSSVAEADTREAEAHFDLDTFHNPRIPPEAEAPPPVEEEERIAVAEDEARWGEEEEPELELPAEVVPVVDTIDVREERQRRRRRWRRRVVDIVERTLEATWVAEAVAVEEPKRLVKSGEEARSRREVAPGR